MTIRELADRTRNAAASEQLRRESGPVEPELVYRLCEQARERMRVDVNAASASVGAAYAAARCIRDERALAEALRMIGHVSYLRGHYRQAASAYRRAIAILDRLGLDVDVGRTLSSALQSLIYLGRYDDALEWAGRARKVFERQGDALRLARLDSNAGNVLHRQDRYEEALALYGRAVDGLRACGDAESAAIALRNMAVCHASLHDFGNAIGAYGEAEGIYREEGLTLLAAEVDDNIAYLYYMRGDYLRALSLYRSSDVEGRGNTYHAAVAKLDQSDLLLELNLFTEAARLAEDAAQRFAQLGVRYERAKALVNLAIASFRTSETERALPMLARARGMFGREKNIAWQATTDYYRAVLLLEMELIGAARRAAVSAVEAIECTSLAGKSILALLLLARIELLDGHPSEARGYYLRAQSKRGLADTLPMRFQMAMMAGALFEAEGDYRAARTEYETARSAMETIRVQFATEGLRISFLSDKQAVYEHLVRLAASGLVEVSIEVTLGNIDHAKSRSLAESMTHGTLGDRFATESGDVQAVRQQLSWCYRQLDRSESAKEPPSPQAAENLRHRIAACEERLAMEFAVRGNSAGPRTAEAELSLDRLQATLPDGGALLDYFVASGKLYLFVITRTHADSASLGDFGEIERTCRLLRFQMSRSTLGIGGPEPRDPRWLAATETHLRRLHQLLIEPACPWLPDGHWVIVPHGPLHRVPFHALHDGVEYVIDRRSVSYAPSTTVHRLCQEKPAVWTEAPVVFGVQDDRAPYILDEARAVAELLPQSRLFTGPEATRERLAEAVRHSRMVHLATHGMVRQDNPLFSSIRLSDARLCLYDLYDFELAAELVTLSGCATGVHETRGADEILGLGRGLLAAGASAVQLSLWEVNDRSTAEYMVRFYTNLGGGCPIAEAGRRAMIETRDRYWHPYYWAPFAITGRVQGGPRGIFSGGVGNPT